jgi:tRNA threonylcarbamoyladenosine biosynthesis protein TsaB
LTRLLAIDTSSAWCSVALSLDDVAMQLRHEPVSAGASQLLLPWIDELLLQSKLTLSDLDAIAIGIGPGAFTGVRLGVAAVQGLAIAANLPVLPVASLDAIAAQLVKTEDFQLVRPDHFVIAVDARMDEIYWAKYQYGVGQVLPKRMGEIQLSRPEDIDLKAAHYLAGSAINAYGDRLFTQDHLPANCLDAQIHISALGILDCAKQMHIDGKQCSVQELEPLYVRNKVALTTNEREIAFNKSVQS